MDLCVYVSMDRIDVAYDKYTTIYIKNLPNAFGCPSHKSCISFQALWIYWNAPTQGPLPKIEPQIVNKKWDRKETLLFCLTNHTHIYFPSK